MLADTLDGRGVWARQIGDRPADAAADVPQDLDMIRRLQGRVGVFLGVSGTDRREALDRARRLLQCLRT